jgi:hypothetical protein
VDHFPPDADLVGRVFRERLADEPEYAYVADRDSTAGTITVWRYTPADGFRSVTEEDVTWLDAACANGVWAGVDGLPRAILEQVTGDEVPYEPG